MLILALYIIPSLWMSYLAGAWILYLLIGILIQVPPESLEVMANTSGILLALGTILTLGGHCFLCWEVLANKHIKLNLDAITTYIGASLIGLALLMFNWPTAVCNTILALFITPNILAGLVHIATKFTFTALGTLSLLLSISLVLSLLTWISWLLL